MKKPIWVVMPFYALFMNGCAQHGVPAENWKFFTILFCGFGVLALMVVWAIAQRRGGQKSAPRRRRRFHFHRHN
ncbi:MAG: hypothetical protein LBD02_07910 [Christensenellaceae bacterium]|jgi:membrane protein implicated in regulation of membrane protease activity|nr:hypothetical protein [Christensenellaceae bacterium]